MSHEDQSEWIEIVVTKQQSYSVEHPNAVIRVCVQSPHAHQFQLPRTTCPKCGSRTRLPLRSKVDGELIFY